MVKNEGDKRVPYIDLLRVFAIVLVIGFHFAYQFSYDNNWRYVGFTGISLFFIISGFLLAKKYPNLEKFNFKWFAKRYLKVAVLYYLALVAVMIIFSKQVYSGGWLGNLVSHFFFLDFLWSKTAYGIISPAWFLIPLMGLYLLYPFINSFLKENEHYVIVGFILALAYRILQGQLTSYSPFFFLGEFCFGIMFAYGYKREAMIASLMLIFVDPWMILPFFIFFALSFIEFGGKTSKVIGFIGANTLALFLFHESFLRVIAGRWKIPSVGIGATLIVLVFVSISLTYLSKNIEGSVIEKLKLNKDKIMK